VILVARERQILPGEESTELGAVPCIDDVLRDRDGISFADHDHPVRDIRMAYRCGTPSPGGACETGEGLARSIVGSHARYSRSRLLLEAFPPSQSLSAVRRQPPTHIMPR
jgi:hypothetical protein